MEETHEEIDKSINNPLDIIVNDEEEIPTDQESLATAPNTNSAIEAESRSLNLPGIATSGDLDMPMPESLHYQYQNDPFFREILTKPAHYMDFEERDGLVFYKHEGKERLCIPNVMIGSRNACEIVIKHAHSLLAHLGTKKTLNFLRDEVWWKTMVDDVDAYSMDQYCEAMGISHPSKLPTRTNSNIPEEIEANMSYYCLEVIPKEEQQIPKWDIRGTRVNEMKSQNSLHRAQSPSLHPSSTTPMSHQYNAQDRLNWETYTKQFMAFVTGHGPDPGNPPAGYNVFRLQQKYTPSPGDFPDIVARARHPTGPQVQMSGEAFQLFVSSMSSGRDLLQSIIAQTLPLLAKNSPAQRNTFHNPPNRISRYGARGPSARSAYRGKQHQRKLNLFNRVGRQPNRLPVPLGTFGPKYGNNRPTCGGRTPRNRNRRPKSEKQPEASGPSTVNDISINNNDVTFPGEDIVMMRYDTPTPPSDDELDFDFYDEPVMEGFGDQLNNGMAPRRVGTILKPTTSHLVNKFHRMTLTACDDDSSCIFLKRDILKEWEGKQEKLTVLEMRVEETVFILKDLGVLGIKDD
ncbi:hypothetical protein BDQ12DRAFT_728580 [Crucibulum laeve]|uniref:Integrase zinc-binding domain-containing protein n=1 Tax=Crucibulum laeve TaxID=68775 RepID=A0A5C3LI61_9AGAR|nr:hypothetical protein BDQ12DRAFT_728580 [Crucibulum laeve]